MAKGVEPMKGKVLAREGRFFIEYGNETHELDPMLVGGVEVLKRVAGREVELVTQVTPWIAGVIWDKVRIVCYLPPPDIWGTIRGGLSTLPAAHAHVETETALVRMPRPVCYVPADWVIRGVEDVVRRNLLKQFVDDKIITAEVYEQLAG